MQFNFKRLMNGTVYGQEEVCLVNGETELSVNIPLLKAETMHTQPEQIGMFRFFGFNTLAIHPAEFQVVHGNNEKPVDRWMYVGMAMLGLSRLDWFEGQYDAKQTAEDFQLDDATDKNGASWRIAEVLTSYMRQAWNKDAHYSVTINALPVDVNSLRVVYSIIIGRELSEIQWNSIYETQKEQLASLQALIEARAGKIAAELQANEPFKAMRHLH